MQIATKTLQAKLLSMLKQFHDVCVENGLTYYMVGGTLLGAVRHQGFIPWDDDVDVAMPRADYNKLKVKASSLLPINLEIKFYENTPNSPMHYVKLIDKGTTLIENKYRNYYEGVYIDVFPLDGAPSNLSLLKKTQRKAGRYQSLIMNHCYTDGRSGIRKIYGLFAKMLDLNKLHNNLEKHLSKYSFDTSELVGNYLGSYGIREFVPKEYFGSPRLYAFEDAQLYGPENYDAYLKNIYGDYMKLPPEEKRINTHQYYYVDLNIPYQEYKMKELKGE